MSKEKFVRDKPHITTGILIMLLGALVLTSLGMMIYDDILIRADADGDTISDYEELKSIRPMSFGATHDEISIYSALPRNGSDGGIHELGHILGISHDGVNAYLSVQSRSFDESSDIDPILELSLSFKALIEFLDVDHDGLFNVDEDVVLGTTPFTNLQRTEFGFGFEDQPVYYSRYASADGKIQIEFYTAREHVLLGRQVGLMTPNELFWRISVSNLIPITGGTSFALNLSLSSSSSLNFTQEKVSAYSGDFETSFIWPNSAIINGTDGNINVSTSSTAEFITQNEIYFNFGAITNLSLDQKMIWNIPYPPDFSITELPWNYVGIISMALLLAGVTYQVIRKRPGRLKYRSIPAESDINKPRDEKRIPHNLKHRDR